MIFNPLASPLFWATARTLGGVLAVGLVLLLAVEHRHVRQLRSRVLFQRWLVWAVIAPLFSLAVLGGALVTLAMVSLLVAQGLREYSGLVGLPTWYRVILMAMGLALGPLAVWDPSLFFSILPLLLIAATLQPLLTQDVHGGFRWLAVAALGFAYLPLLLGHVLLIAAWLPGGTGLLLVLGLSIAFSDVGAFVVGKSFGRHRLSPLVSPNKTWEGALGNVLGA